MEYRKVGKYGLKVSAMSLGKLADIRETIDQEKSKKLYTLHMTAVLHLSTQQMLTMEGRQRLFWERF